MMVYSILDHELKAWFRTSRPNFPRAIFTLVIARTGIFKIAQKDKRWSIELPLQLPI
jgi:hypothetical protein